MDHAVTGARLHVITRDTPSRLETAYGAALAARPHVIVTLSAGSVAGSGEATPLAEFTGETAPGIARVLERVYLPRILGRDPREIARIMADLDRVLPGNPSAKAAIDTALHDLLGRLFGQPVCRLLGGPLRCAVTLARAIGLAPVEQAVALARGYTEAGFRTLKLKVGADPTEDVARVRAVRDAVGPGVAIRLDANQGYDVETAQWVLGRLEASGLEYVEQPLPSRDLDGLRALRRRTPVRLMADEGVHTPEDARRLAKDRLVDLFSIKLIKVGGLTRAREIAAIAADAGIECVVSSPYETQIGAAAGLHLAVSLPRASHAHELTVFVTQPDMAVTDIVLDGCRLRPGAA